MLIINYVHKLQGLDKSLPVCLELREQLGARVINLIELEPDGRESDVLAFQPLIEACTDQSWTLRPRRSTRRRGWMAKLLDRWQHQSLPGSRLIDAFRLWLLPQQARQLIDELQRSSDPLVLLTIYNGIHSSMGGILARLTARKGGLRVGYLKSLHDQGLGLSDLSARSANLTQRLILEPCLDALLVPEHLAFRAMLESKGVRRSQMITGGYPPSYRSWREMVRSRTKGKVEQSPFTVILFTRGEVAHKPVSEQIIDDRWLHQAIKDLAQELELLWPGYRLWVKPHPYQKREPLQRICQQHSSLALVDGPPCLLAAQADLAIATYSSAILDAVAAGVPSIEWFESTPAFRRLHPDGSPFPAFGVLQASDREQLRTLLESLATGKWPMCDKMNSLGSQLDLTRFKKLLKKRGGARFLSDRSSSDDPKQQQPSHI